MNTRSILDGRLMCGILGYFHKGAATDHQLGATMLSMLEALGRRGPDSAGVALVGPAYQPS
jgi:methylamine---glutamate N-methyltransferase subunit A